MTTYIKIPFAQSGDKTNPPDTDAAGGVNWTQGYPLAYSKDPATDPAARRIEREMFNGILNRLSAAINEIQINGVAPYITAADNGGVTPAYGIGAFVHYNDAVWWSKVDANTAVPTEGANWTKVATASNLGTVASRNVGQTRGSQEIPDMSMFPYSQSGQNAWFKLPNGLTVMMFTRTLNNGGVGTTLNTNIQFPFQFPTRVLAVTHVKTSYVQVVASAEAINNIGFIAVAYNIASPDSTSIASYIAIGE